MVRNEEDVIELFVRHNLHVVDEMIIVDHLSTDNTVGILDSLVAEGLPIQIVKETHPGFYQPKILTQEMRRAARELSADWVIPLDADEFLTSQTGDTRKLLEGLERSRVTAISWKTYVPRSQDLKEDSFLFDRICHRREPEASPHPKVIVPGKIAGKRGVELKMGNHGVRDYSRLRNKTLEMVPMGDLRLAHFPVRSETQVKLKALQNRMALVVALGLETTVGKHLRPIFDALRNGEEISGERIAEYAFDYAVADEFRSEPISLVEDPILSNTSAGDLKYTCSSRQGAVPALIRLAEDQAVQILANKRMGFWAFVRERFFGK